MSISRRIFLGSAALASVAAGARRGRREASGFPHQDPDLVRQVVGASHANIDRVRELVSVSPELAKSSWDWGFGDWESALGAASHTGRREIALLLIDHGARPNLFTHAMLGHLEVVKATIEAQPGVQRIPGPHGISLLRHASSGREQAAEVKAYLEALGDADPSQDGLEISEAHMDIVVGSYRTEDGFDFTIERWRDRIAFQTEEGPARALFRVGEHTFHPAGAPGAAFEFTVEGGRAVRVVFGGTAAGLSATRTG